MQTLFEMFTFFELIMLSLVIEGFVLVLAIKLGLMFARRLNWLSQEKYIARQLKQSQKYWLLRNKPVLYLPFMLLIPALMGVRLAYQAEPNVSQWSSQSDTALSNALQTELTQYLLDNDIPQLCVGVKKNGEHISACAEQIGHHEDEPLNADTIFEIGSISKTFTVAAMIKVLEKHSIALNAEIGPYLPVDLLDCNPNLGTIQWNELATHTSGLNRMPIGFNLETSKSIFDALVMNNNAAAFNDQYILSYLQKADIQTNKAYAPKYSNLGMGLLGYLISRIEKKSYANLLDDEVILPLNLSRTTPDNTNWPNRAQAIGQFRTIGKLQIIGRSEYMEFSDALAGAGSVNASTRDMLTYLEQSIEQFNSPVYQERKHIAKYTERTHVNLGWFVSTVADTQEENIVWHDGGTAGFRSYMGFSESGNEGIVVLSSGTKRVDKLGSSILKRLINKRVQDAPLNSFVQI